MKVRSNKIADILSYYQQKLTEHYNNDEAKSLIRLLIADFVDIPKHTISLNLDKRISESELLLIHFGVKDLLRDKPIQYILGKAEFLDWNFKVQPVVLIPRPETEELVLLAFEAIKNKSELKLLDIGTGSGVIAISMAKKLAIKTYAIDISPSAIAIAKENSHKIEAKVKFELMDILDPSQWNKLDYQWDVIISNPPYVREQEKTMMQANVTDYEPHLALFVDDDDALLFYRNIALYATHRLKPSGEIWFEINEYLSDKLRVLMLKYFFSVEIINDFRGRKRFCHAKTLRLKR